MIFGARIFLLGAVCVSTCRGDGRSGGSLCDPNPCLNGARCQDNMAFYFCHCTDGYIGDNCEIKCPSGRFGFFCKSNCSNLCDKNTCNNVNGQCTCKPGLSGALCDTECEKGKFGAGCLSVCSSGCVDGACDKVNGKCKCRDGWSGPQCSITCPQGKYGKTCAKNCSEGCRLGICTTSDGLCSCLEGWTGDRCVEELVREGEKEGSATSLSVGIIAIISTSGFVAVSVAIIMIVVIVRRVRNVGAKGGKTDIPQEHMYINEQQLGAEVEKTDIPLEDIYMNDEQLGAAGSDDIDEHGIEQAGKKALTPHAPKGPTARGPDVPRNQLAQSATAVSSNTSATQNATASASSSAAEDELYENAEGLAPAVNCNTSSASKTQNATAAAAEDDEIYENVGGLARPASLYAKLRGVYSQLRKN